MRSPWSVGVMMILLSYLIGVGVCLHLGAVVGRAWNERNAASQSATQEVPPMVDVWSLWS